MSRVVEEAFVRWFDVDLAEAAPRANAYPSFDALFTRPLRAGARTVADAPLVSPADGMVRATGVMGKDGRILVKGSHYSAHELIGDDDAERFATGAFVVIYLSPRDYHRVHSPVSGELTRINAIPGDLFPVNSIGERIPRLYARNARVALRLETSELGGVALVMVGALLVGRISVTGIDAPSVPLGAHEVEPPRAVAKGDELGVFHLGSSVVLFIERARGIVPAGQRVRYGESLLRTP